jgi:hypothetical protein
MLAHTQFWTLSWHNFSNPHSHLYKNHLISARRFSLRALGFSNKFVCAIPPFAPSLFTHHKNCRQGTRIANFVILKEIDSKFFTI